jgi:N-acetylneuraminic acid mutarotase
VHGQLPVPRSDLAAATIGSTTYILGGFTGSALPRRILATTDGRHFRTVGALRQGVRYPAVTTYHGQVWVIGGLLAATESNAGPQTNEVQRFDPVTGRTTVINRMSVELAHASAFVLAGTIYVAGGKVAGRPQTTIYRINPITGQVSQAGRLPSPRADASVYVTPTYALLLGGELTAPAAPLDTVVRVAIARPTG